MSQLLAATNFYLWNITIVSKKDLGRDFLSGMEPSLSDSKVIDKRVRSEQQEYAISFAARSGQGDYDHAFIIWFYSDAAKLRTTRRAAGFYPVGGDKYDLLIGGAPGKVLDDSKEGIGRAITVLVNIDTFNKALQVEYKYSNGTYRLLMHDCTTFVEEVCETVPGLVVPNRVVNVFPSSFIDALYMAN